MTLTTRLVVGMRPDISTTLPRRLVGLSSSLALRSRARERSARLPGPVQAGRGFGKNEEKPKAQEPQGVEMKESDVPIDNASTSGRLEVATSSDISEEVTDRALQRMLTFSGIPFAVGLVFFPLFWYLKVIKHVDIPMWLVYVISTLFLGGSLAGISYGLLSTSGSPSQKNFLGVDEFKRNVGNITKK